MGLRVGVVVVAVDMVAIVGAPLGAGAGAEEGMMRARVDVVADLYKVVGVVDSMVPERQLLIQFCGVTRAYIHEIPRSMAFSVCQRLFLSFLSWINISGVCLVCMFCIGWYYIRNAVTVIQNYNTDIFPAFTPSPPFHSIAGPCGGQSVWRNSLEKTTIYPHHHGSPGYRHIHLRVHSHLLK